MIANPAEPKWKSWSPLSCWCPQKPSDRVAGLIVDSYGHTDRKAEQKKGLGSFAIVEGKGRVRIASLIWWVLCYALHGLYRPTLDNVYRYLAWDVPQHYGTSQHSQNCCSYSRVNAMYYSRNDLWFAVCTKIEFNWHNSLYTRSPDPLSRSD